MKVGHKAIVRLGGQVARKKALSDWVSVRWGRKAPFVRLALCLLSVSACPVFGTIIPSTNAPTAVWAVAGVPGGIPNRTNVYATLSPGATAAQIQSAINNCPSGQVVKLNAGTYNINAIRLQAPGNWVLRGAGMGKTILKMSGGSANFYMGDYPPWAGSWDSTVDITSGGKQAGTNITLSSGSDYTVGDLAVIDMENSDWIVGYGAGGTGDQVMNEDSSGKERDGNRVQLHVVEITAINGTNLSFWPPLPYDLEASRSPQLSKFGARGPRWSGIEDLTFNCSGTESAGLFMGGTYACWLKNVEVKNWGTFGVYPRWSACFEMRGCYVHEPNTYNWSKGYALQMDPCSGSLIIDNIFYKDQDTVLMQGGCAGNVLAYNFISFSYNGYLGIQWLLQEAGINHSPFPAYNLFEGNYIGKLQPDYYYGPSGWGTVLRNRITGNGPWITENRVAVSIDAQQRYYSVVGNQLGESTAPNSLYLAKPNVTLTYAEPGAIEWGYDPGSTNFSYGSPYIYRLGYPFSGNNDSDSGTAVHDPFVKTNTLRHGNWDAANNAVVWDPDIADHNIPNSLFLSRKPDWFGNLTWPPYGPSAPSSVTNDLAKIPAGYRLLYNRNPPAAAINQLPVAQASATPVIVGTNQTVKFSSAGSYDPEGVALSYNWTFGDGTTSTTANPAKAYMSAGAYVARLTVSDGYNTKSSGNVTITVTNVISQPEIPSKLKQGP